MIKLRNSLPKEMLKALYLDIFGIRSKAFKKIPCGKIYTTEGMNWTVR